MTKDAKPLCLAGPITAQGFCFDGFSMYTLIKQNLKRGKTFNLHSVSFYQLKQGNHRFLNWQCGRRKALLFVRAEGNNYDR
jgi:hypothetical protein